MPRQAQHTRKHKQQTVVKKPRNDTSRILDPQGRASKRNKHDATDAETADVAIPSNGDEKQGLSRSKSQPKSKAKPVTGILTTQDSNVQTHDTIPTTRRRSSRVVNTKKAKPLYFEPPSSATEDDDSDDESDGSLASLPNSNLKNVASSDQGKKAKSRSKKPTKTLLQHERSSPNKSPTKKKTRVVSTAGTPLYAGIDVKKPSPASSSIKEITKNMWKDNEGDWRVESAMDY